MKSKDHGSAALPPAELVLRVAEDGRILGLTGPWAEVVGDASALVGQPVAALVAAAKGGAGGAPDSRQRASDALHDSIRDRVFEKSRVAMCVVGESNGRIVEVNQAFERISGRSAARVVGLLLEEVGFEAAGADDHSVARALREAMTTPTELELVDGAGRRRSLLWSATEVTSGGEDYLLLSGLDISRRRRAEDALRQSEQNFRRLSDRLPLAIYLSSGVEQVAEYVNPKFVELFGYTIEDVPSVQEWWPRAYPDPAYRKQIDDEWTEKVNKALATQTEIEPMETVVTCKDGSTKSILWGYVPLGDKNFAHGLDLTESNRSRRQHALWASVLTLLNERASLVDAVDDILVAIKTELCADAAALRVEQGEDFPYLAGDGFSEHFLQSDGPLILRDDEGIPCRDADGCSELACACGVVLAGRTAPECGVYTPGGSFWNNDLRPDDSSPDHGGPSIASRRYCALAGFRSVLLVPITDRGRSLGLLQLCSRAPGHFRADQVRFLEEIGLSLGLAMGRMRAQADLRRQSQLLEATGRIARIGGWDLDAKTLELTWSEEVFRILERPHTYVPTLEQTLDYYLPEHRDLVRDATERALEQGVPFELEVAVHTATGRRREVVVKGQPTYEDDVLVKVIGTVQDVTEKHQVEASLAQIQRLESLGTLAGGIAHDFNNFLTAILGNLSLLELELDPGGDVLELLQEAQTACQTAAGLAGQLLTFAKGGAPVVQTLDLQPVVLHAASFASRGMSARCVYELGDAPLWVKVDRSQISQVIQNLVLNAAQAMPDGGQIRLTGEVVELSAGERHNLVAGRYVRLAVRDSGPGIRPELLPRIFEPYFSTRGHGRGLGLAVCFSILARHGGHIHAESEPGAGASFVMHFPAVDASEVEESVTVPTDTFSRGGRVLVMDDESSVAKLLVRMLEHLGFEADAVLDGQAALDAWVRSQEGGTPYDLVIMDLTIPGGMGGKEAVRRLLELDPRARCIVSSGYSNDPVMADHRAYGFLGVLEKPYSIEVARRVLGQVLDARA